MANFNQTYPQSLYQYSQQSTYPQSLYQQSTHPQSLYPQSLYPQSLYQNSLYQQPTHLQSPFRNSMDQQINQQINNNVGIKEALFERIKNNNVDAMFNLGFYYQFTDYNNNLMKKYYSNALR